MDLNVLNVLIHKQWLKNCISFYDEILRFVTDEIVCYISHFLSFWKLHFLFDFVKYCLALSQWFRVCIHLVIFQIFSADY